MKGILIRLQVAINWLLLVAQVLLSWYFGLETVRSAISTGEVSIAWMLCSFLFVLMGTLLAHGSWKEDPVVGARNILLLYINGALIYSMTLTFSALYGDWDGNDSKTMSIVGFLLMPILFIKYKNKISWRSPILQAIIGMSAKSVPQMLFALEIWVRGLNPLTWTAVLVFHMLTTLRIAQVLFQEGKWNTKRRWLLIAEITNELSWCAVTIAIFYNTWAAKAAQFFYIQTKKIRVIFVSLGV